MAGQTTNYLFDYPTSTDYVKDGATAIQTLATDVDTTLFTALGGAYPGLRLVKKQTIGSAVASVTVTGAFSATYENYKVLISGGVGSTSASLGLSLGGITTGYYANMVYQSFGSTTVTGAQQSNVSNWIWSGSFNTSSIYMDFDVQGPFLTKPKKASSRYNELSNSATNGTPNFWNASTTSATDLTITASSGTVTGGTIYVYGYGAS